MESSSLHSRPALGYIVGDQEVSGFHLEKDTKETAVIPISRQDGPSRYVVLLLFSSLTLHHSPLPLFHPLSQCQVLHKAPILKDTHGVTRGLTTIQTSNIPAK